jgi:uncharacterized protein
MDLALIAIVAALASALTLYSGFGLGTILLPAFALFLPVPAAIAATGIVHLLNNLFKGTLLRHRADWPTVLRFGLPAVPAAILGAWLLARLSATPRLFAWSALGGDFGPSAAGMIVGIMLMVLAALELQPWFAGLRAPARLMPAGGALTGFLGGLTGQQGALRSIFLLRAGMAADRFIATGVMIAVLVDLSRLATYAAAFRATGIDPQGRELLLVAVGAVSATLGAWIAIRRIDKVTIRSVRLMVAGLMMLIGAALAAGVIGSPA